MTGDGNGSKKDFRTNATGSQGTLQEAARFLKCLDPGADFFTFQTFDDDHDRKDKRLARVLHGTFGQHVTQLEHLNKKGAGIFVTVNETDGKGRTTKNIVRVRALFIDLDGAPLAPVMQASLKPHIVTETSPGRWHAYWRVEGLALDEFTSLQTAVAVLFRSDPKVKDLPRVMRMPGFEHRKGAPFRARIKSFNERVPYTPEEIKTLRSMGSRNQPPDYLFKKNMDGRGAEADEKSEWQTLNDQALQMLSSWVPEIFGDRAVLNSSGVYRVSSKALGRDLEEDLSLAPTGIVDFGIADQGDQREGKRTPIDIVMEYGRKDLDKAVTWLKEKLGLKPAGPASEDTKDGAGIKATPFVWVDPTQIPKRKWLYKPHYVSQFVSLTVSTGGVGKSSLIIAEALAMVTGKALLKIAPTRPLRVWYWNGEDPMDELQRRIAAAIKHYGLTINDIGERLFVNSGRTMPIVVARELRRETQIAEPVVQQVIEVARELNIDVLMIDPFVTCHRVNENDNGAIERVAKSWSHVAETANCAVMLVHHSRKTGSDGVTVDDGRGASSLLAAARTARSLNTMTTSEAENAEVDEHERRTYFRADIGKANLTKPAEAAEWFKLSTVDLENAGADADWHESDLVGVVTHWDYPKLTMLTPTQADIRRAQDGIKAGGPWRADQRSKNEPWVGIPIATALGLDLGRRPIRRSVLRIIDDWLSAGILKRVDGRDRRHEAHDYIEVGTNPGVDEARGNGSS